MRILRRDKSMNDLVRAAKRYRDVCIENDLAERKDQGRPYTDEEWDAMVDLIWCMDWKAITEGEVEL